MANPQSDQPEETDATRMELGPDTLHEGDDGIAIDCPQCGATVPITFLVAAGRCPNALDPDEVEVESEVTTPADVECSAELGLELVWRA